MLHHLSQQKIFFMINTLIYFFILYENGSSKRIAQKKCEEYSELIFHKEESPVLRIDAVSNITVSDCGIIETPLIVGGTKAKSREFPHMAVIGYGKDIIYWQCGGSIISEIYILTAAHCLHSTDHGPANKVRVGMINMKIENSKMQERNIVKKIKHPEYKTPVRYNDIALLKLDEPLNFNSDVRPACLEIETDLEQIMIGERSLIATGFGKTAYDADYGNDDLMKVSLHYIKLKDCQKYYEAETGSTQLPKGLIESMLCAGIMEGGKDTCQGDSGGPLQRVLKQPYCMYSIVGITSFGKFCAFKNSPAIYSQVNSFLDWIENIVWSP